MDLKIDTDKKSWFKCLCGENYFVYTLAICGLLTVIKLLCLYFVKVNLWVDEAQYWAWSKDLAFGYYSKPPVIAWIIYATTHIFGDSEFGIRFASPIMHFITSIFVYLIGKDIYDKRVGFYSAITYITLPAVSISSIFISTDAPLLMFWAASVYFLIYIIRINNSVVYWFLYAICIGLGLMSKYTVAALVIMSFIYIFTNRKGKEIFKPDFWLANVLAFMIFVPNILWNYDNHFVSFLHTSENVVTGSEAGGIKILKMLEFVASQFLILGPALVFFVIALIKDRQTEADEKKKKNTLLLFSLPLLAVGIIISLISGAQAHWAAPAYITAIIFTIHFILKLNRMKWMKIILLINVGILILCLNIKIPAKIVSLGKDPLERVNVWYKPVKDIKIVMSRYPDAMLVAHERKIIAPLMYALRDENGNPKKIYKWNNEGLVRDHYDLTSSFTDKSERDIIFISKGDIDIEYLSSVYFNITTLKAGDEKSPFYLHLLKGRRDNN